MTVMQITARCVSGNGTFQLHAKLDQIAAIMLMQTQLDRQAAHESEERIVMHPTSENRSHRSQILRGKVKGV